MSRRIGGRAVSQVSIKTGTGAALNLVGIDSPPAGSKAIAKTELHALGEPSREAYHDLIGKPGILVCALILRGSEEVKEMRPGRRDSRSLVELRVKVKAPSLEQAPSCLIMQTVYRFGKYFQRSSKSKRLRFISS